MPRSQNPHRPPLRYFIFEFFIIFVELPKNFHLPEIAPLIENHVTSQGYKSYAKNGVLDIRVKIEAFLVII